MRRKAELRQLRQSDKAAATSAARPHSEGWTPCRFAAASTAFRSLVVSLIVSVSAFRSAFGFGGRPIFGLLWVIKRP